MKLLMEEVKTVVLNAITANDKMRAEAKVEAGTKTVFQNLRSFRFYNETAFFLYNFFI
jgi:hypothetical protein